MPRNHGSRSSGAHIGQPALIMENQFDLSGFLAEDQNHSVGDRKIEFGIVIEPGRHLENINVVVFYVAIFDVNVSRRLLKMQETDRRNDHPTFRIEDKSGFDFLDEPRSIDDPLYFIECQYLRHECLSRFGILVGQTSVEGRSIFPGVGPENACPPAPGER